jgi:hypothetical protein
MHITRNFVKDTYYIGGSERRIALFENIYPLNNGVSYNSYLILDEKTALLDTVDHSIKDLFFENLEYQLFCIRNELLSGEYELGQYRQFQSEQDQLEYSLLKPWYYHQNILWLQEQDLSVW